MNTEPVSHPPPPPSTSTEDTHSLPLPSFLSSSSSSLKPLRERNRTNLKRRANLSRSQVLSNDFENDDNLLPTHNASTSTTVTTNSQPLPSTPTIHPHAELYSKTISPKTPSPIHNTVTCSQVWDRLASNEEHQNPISPKPVPAPTASLPTHISFSYDPSDDEEEEEEEEEEDLSRDDKNDFQYVPVSSQSKLVQFQFLTFARQQQLDIDNDGNDKNNNKEKQSYDSDDDDEDEDEDDEQDDTLVGHPMEDNEEEQENRSSKKRKRSVSTTDSLDGISALPPTNNDAAASLPTTKQPRTKKPKVKDPNANFQLLNMRKKSYSHAKKHQFGKNKRNAFYRRMRHAGGK